VGNEIARQESIMISSVSQHYDSLLADTILVPKASAALSVRDLAAGVKLASRSARPLKS
jgi:hypothetical protein